MIQNVSPSSRLQFGLGPLVCGVALAAGLFAVYRVNFWGGLLLSIVPPAIWLGRVIAGRLCNNRALGGIIGATLSFALVAGLEGLRPAHALYSDPIDMTLALITTLVVGTLFGVGTEVIFQRMHSSTVWPEAGAGAIERMWKGCRRNPTVVSLAGAVFMLLVTYAFMGTCSSMADHVLRARRAEERAEVARAAAELQETIEEIRRLKQNGAAP